MHISERRSELYQKHGEEYLCNGTQAFAGDSIFNQKHVEWPFYATWTAFSYLLFPRHMRYCLSVCPQGQFSAAYEDQPTPEVNKRKRRNRSREEETEEKHVAPDIVIFYNALKPGIKDVSQMSDLELIRYGAAKLDHNISKVMVILEAKRDCNADQLNENSHAWLQYCTANIQKAQTQGYEQAQLCFATHPNSTSVVAIATGGNGWRWTVFYRSLTQPAELYLDGCYVPSPETDQDIAMRKVPPETLRILNERIMNMSRGNTSGLEVHTPANSVPNSPSASPRAKRLKYTSLGSPFRGSTKPQKSPSQESPPRESPPQESPPEQLPPGKYVTPQWSETTGWGTGVNKSEIHVALDFELQEQFPEQFQHAEMVDAQLRQKAELDLETLDGNGLDFEERAESVPASEVEEGASDTGSDSESHA